MKTQLLDVISSNSRTMFFYEAFVMVVLFAIMHLLLTALTLKNIRTISAYSALSAVAGFIILTLMNTYIMQPIFSQGADTVPLNEMFWGYNVLTFVYSLVSHFLQRRMFIKYLETATTLVTVAS